MAILFSHKTSYSLSDCLTGQYEKARISLMHCMWRCAYCMAMFGVSALIDSGLENMPFGTVIINLVDAFIIRLAV